MVAETTYRFELYVRSLEPATASPAQRQAVETLVDLASAEDVTFDLQVWGDRLPLDSTSARTETVETLHARVRDLRAWAAKRDAELPGFERTHTDTLVGPTREALTLPSLLIAVYRSDELVAVAPRVERGTHYCVTGTLERLAESADLGQMAASPVRS